jgi:predicted nucleotidyltransferase component of viral defense system
MINHNVVGSESWSDQFKKFIELCNDRDVRMLMVGGGAVNFHGYQRHSADVDFWISTTGSNLERLAAVLRKMDFDFDDLPEEVSRGLQNISIKFSPLDPMVELITRFSSKIKFEDAYARSESHSIDNQHIRRWRVISFEDLIESKILSGRPKDLLDVQELKRIRHDK